MKDKSYPSRKKMISYMVAWTRINNVYQARPGPRNFNQWPTDELINCYPRRGDAKWPTENTMTSIWDAIDSADDWQ